MTLPDDGGPAFPLYWVSVKTAIRDSWPVYNHTPGMTLRDYFAAAALTGLAADEDGDPLEIAQEAYVLADRMLRVRNDPVED